MSRRVPHAPRRPRRRLGALFVVVALVCSSSPVAAQEATQVPARPTGLEVATAQGSLDVSVDWDDTDGAASYRVRWRAAGAGNPLNEGTSVDASTAAITVDGYGDWVVRIEACNTAGCGPSSSKRFGVEPQLPARPTGLAVATAQGSLDLSASWDATQGADSYRLRWRRPSGGFGDNQTTTTDTAASITVDGYGQWVVRIEACNTAGCGRGATLTLKVEPAPETTTTVEPTQEPPLETSESNVQNPPNRAPVVDEDADNYDSFTGSHTAPRGTVVFKSFEGIFSDPDGDDLTYTVSAQHGHADLVETLRFHTTSDRVGFQYDGDDDWNAADPALPDPITTEITLTATDPDGLSASLKGKFHADWESHPVLKGVDAHQTTMIVVFDHNLQTTPAPLPGQFTVKATNADGTSAGTIAVESLEIRDRRVILTLASAAGDGQSLTLDYAHHDDRPLKRAAAGGDSAPGFTGQFVWLLVISSDPVDERSNLIVATDNPASDALVSNTGKATFDSPWSLNSWDVAQGFDTGSHPPGYTLAAVRIKLEETPTIGLTYPAFSVRICRASGAVPSTSCLGRRPLYGPAILGSGVKTFIVLTHPGTGIHLEPDTNYFVVIDVTAAGTKKIEAARTLSHDEDAGAAAGWSIANAPAFREFDSAGAWQLHPVRGPLQIEVVGFQNYADYDTDYDGLIEISNADQLNAIRYDENGDGTADVAANQSSYTAAFPHAVPGMGCPEAGCTGYELARDIDLAGRAWTPIPNLRTTLEGNGHEIENLTVLKGETENTAALIGTILSNGKVRNLGLVDVNVRASQVVGALAGTNQGLIFGSYSTGRVSAVASAASVGALGVGGLVSSNNAAGKIHASYSSATVYASAPNSVGQIGGLAGSNSGEIKASYASGSVTAAATGTGTLEHIGGLVGQNNGTVSASYSVGVVNAAAHATHVGGLVGFQTTFGSATNSYWDLAVSGQNASGSGTGKSTAELTAPAGYTGIYANWNVDLDGDGVADDPWHFGTASDYPALILKLPDIAPQPGSVGQRGLRINHRPFPGPAPWRPPAECREGINVVLNTDGLWKGGQYAEPCNSAARPGSHARWYTFTVGGTEPITLNMSLFAPDADAYLYLRAGAVYSGPFIAENDNVRPWPGWVAPTAYGWLDSQLITEIDPGTYTIEVTTRSAGTGGFSLAVSARTN